MTIYCVDRDGNYLGGYDGASTPVGATEVPFPPEDARMRWNGKGYDPLVPEVSDYQNAIQSMVDETARSRRYADGNSMASYDGSTVAAWNNEAKAFKAWRDNVWKYAYSELSKVQGGVRPQPSVDDFLLEMPEIVWP